MALLLLGAAAPAAFAQTQPLLSVSITEVDDDTAGVSFGVNPVYGQSFASGLNSVNVNGGNGFYKDTLTIWGLATGTFPEGGFVYTFYVNGKAIGNAINTEPTPTANMGVTPTPLPTTSFPQGVSWTSPQPGVYYFSVGATDGTHSATSLAVEYFSTGISIVSPVANAILPLGSSVVIQAASAIPDGAISRVDFYADNVLIGSSVNYPYSVIYTPPGPIGTVHEIYAISYKADGVSPAFTANDQGIVIVAPVLPLPVCVITSPTGTPALPSLVAIPDYAASATNAVTVIVNASGGSNISQVELYINGVLFGTETSFPYTFQWQPSITGTYMLTALAYDGKNNVIASTTSTSATTTPSPTTVIIGALPSVAITVPSNNGTISAGGSSTTVTASATDSNLTSTGAPVAITSVQFFQDGNLVGTAITPTTPGGDSYSVTFMATQNFNAVTGDLDESVLTAIATDALGFSSTSAAVDVNVTSGGSGTSPIVGIPPTVSITAPTASENVVVNTPVTLSATGTAPNGNIVQIAFLVDNTVLATATKYPYSVTWTPANLGAYTIIAQVTDNLGDKINSSAVSVVVVPEPPPTVTITSPSSGGIVTAGSGVTITASASSPSGTIAQVQFYANGISIGTATTPPYSITWTPQSAGVYTLTAVTTDNSGEVSNSVSTIVEAVVSTGGLGNTIYFGQYQGLTDGGSFAFAVVDGIYGAYIGHSNSPSAPAVAFFPDLPVGAGGAFTSAGVTGNASVTGVTGTLASSKDDFIGTVTQAGNNPVAAGYYTGSITGQAASQVAAIVGYDGEIMVYVNVGGLTDAGGSTVDSSGAFSIVTPSNNTITGTVNPSTGFLNATLTGGPGGQLLAGRVSGGTFSDGVLRNLSTRGQVGVAGQDMIAGFVVGGSASKQLLVRAIGPTLATLGVPGAIAATQLSVYTGSTLVASNTGWSADPTNASQVTAADVLSGAFALPPGSLDSALVSTFPPGAYTALVSGAGSDTGVGLVEVYDLDQLQLFSSQKLVNVSTRGSVGTGANILIGGFSFDGAAPKRLLIRASGPGLSTMGVAGTLATPRLQLFNNGQQLVRENYSWQAGNDAVLVSAAEAQTGAFAFASGSADSAILIVLPPGNYTAEVSGVGGTTGTALIEVYEVP